MKRWLSICTLCLCCSGVALGKGAISTAAQTKEKAQAEEKSPWDGTSASLGVNVSTGNTQSAVANGGFNLVYVKDPWSNTLNLGVLWGRADGSTNKEKFTAVDQMNYSFHKENKSFFFTNGDFTADRFSPYTYVFVSSAGYGRDLYHSEKLELSAQAGPGWRRNMVRVDQDTDNHVILVTQANMTWNITNKGSLTELLRFDYGTPFDYFQTITAFQNKIIGNLAVQISFELNYYSKIPPMSSYTQKTDTISAVSLVYNF